MNKRELIIFIDGVKDECVALSNMHIFPASIQIYIAANADYEYQLLEL